MRMKLLGMRYPSAWLTPQQLVCYACPEQPPQPHREGGRGLPRAYERFPWRSHCNHHVRQGACTAAFPLTQPLDKSSTSRLESILKSSQFASSGNKTVKFAYKVNPSVEGGIVVDLGERSVDLSVRSRVAKLNSLLRGTFGRGAKTDRQSRSKSVVNSCWVASARNARTVHVSMCLHGLPWCVAVDV